MKIDAEWIGRHAWMAVLLMFAGGFAVSVNLTSILLNRHLAAGLPSAQARFLERAASRRRANDPESAYRFYGLALEHADGRVEQTRAGIEKAAFLIEAGDWRMPGHRYRLARELVQAIADGSYPEAERLRLARLAFTLADRLRDPDMWEAGRAFLPPGLAVVDRPVAVVTAMLDAALALDDPAAVFGLLAEAVEGYGDMQLPPGIRRRRTTAGLRALDDPAWLAGAAGTLVPAGAGRADLLAVVDADFRRLTAVDDLTLAVGALTDLARIRAQDDRADEAILLLQKAMNKTDEGRSAAAVLLLDLLQAKGDVAAADEWRLNMLGHDDTVDAALSDLGRQLAARTDLYPLFRQVDGYIEQIEAGVRPADPEFLLRAAEAAVARDDAARARTYLDVLRRHDVTRSLVTERLVVQVALASADDVPDRHVRYLDQLIAAYPDRRIEREARYALVEALATAQDAEVEALTIAVVGATVRYPEDDRGAVALLRLARRMETLSLYEPARNYYRHAALLFGFERDAGDRSLAAEAMLGQARALLALGHDAEADRMLRTINAHRQWASVRHESGPLWAAVAARQGQYREMVRRWRQTCGPPGCPTLAYLIALLVPDAPTVEIAFAERDRPAPGAVPPMLMRAAAQGAVNRLLAHEDYAELDRLLTHLAGDAIWRDRLPVAAYRIQALEHVLARQEWGPVADWVERHAVTRADRTGGTLPPAELRHWIQTHDAVLKRMDGGLR